MVLSYLQLRCTLRWINSTFMSYFLTNQILFEVMHYMYYMWKKKKDQYIVLPCSHEEVHSTQVCVLELGCCFLSVTGLQLFRLAKGGKSCQPSKRCSQEKGMVPEARHVWSPGWGTKTFSDTRWISWNSNAHVHPETEITAATSMAAAPGLPSVPTPEAEQLGYTLSYTAPAQVDILSPSQKGWAVNYMSLKQQ